MNISSGSSGYGLLTVASVTTTLIILVFGMTVFLPQMLDNIRVLDTIINPVAPVIPELVILEEMLK